MPDTVPAAAAGRTITCLGMDWRAEISLRETLSLLRGRTVESWTYADELNADVIVYDTDNALAQALVRRARAEGAGRVFVPSHSRDPDVITLRPPFGASRLIHSLDWASQQLAGQAPSLPDRLGGLGQQLDDLLMQPGIRAVALRAGGHRGLIDVQTRQLHWPVALELDDMAGWLLGRVELTPLGDADAVTLQALRTAATVVTPAEGLLWTIGITRSNGQLLRRLDAARPYQLRRWPDFGVIGRRSLDLRCTALLMQRPMTPLELSRLAGAPLSVIGHYLNAAALCGVLESPPRTQAAAAGVREPLVSAAAATSGLMGGMLRRLRTVLAMDGA